MELDALNLLNQALEIQRKRGEDFRVTEILSEVGNLWLKLGRQELAKRYLFQAAERFANLNNIFHYAKTLALICELYFDEPNFERLLQTAHEARNLESSEVDYHLDYHLAQVEYWVGMVRVEENNFAEAAASWQEALRRALNVNPVAFTELVDEISSQIDGISAEISPRIAVQLCEKLTSKLKKLSQSSDDTFPIKNAVDIFQRLRARLEGIEPVENEVSKLKEGSHG
jgi:tetratricopeptide (TPR) repeat protein